MINRLISHINHKRAPVCIGLDPQLEFVPEALKNKSYYVYGQTLEGAADALFRFNCQIIDATYDLVPAVKPQSAMYERFGLPGLSVFERTCSYASSKGLIVIGDVKRSDVSSSAVCYAQGLLGSVEVGSKIYKPFDLDFVTVNPYLGFDGIQPFIDVCKTHKKGIFILVKTSNPSSGQFQDGLIDGKTPLYERLARFVDEWADRSRDGGYSDIGAVVGATYPETAAMLRKIMPTCYFLVPGYGAQGAKATDLKPFFNPDGLGAIINSSRGIIAAYRQPEYACFGERDFAGAARQATIDMISSINRYALS